MSAIKAIKDFFSMKSADEPSSVTIETETSPSVVNIAGRNVTKYSPEWFEINVLPRLCGEDFMKMYESIPEVYFPINFIASRIAGAKFEVKRTKDDSIVWYKKELNAFLNHPNCLMSFRELVYTHFVYKLTTGNSFVRAAMGDGVTSDIERRWRWCNNYWVLPANYMQIVPYSGVVPMFGVAAKEDLIKSYRLQFGLFQNQNIPPHEIWHDRDGRPSFHNDSHFMMSNSRLLSQKKAISNLIAVYEARNVIYVKQGGLGFIVSQKQDASGSVALTAKEKEELISQHNDTYGVNGNKLPYGISDQPIGFVRTNLSIKDLEPFEETLQDAITIAGSYGIPSVLVPRKDQSTFSNQATAEKSVYTSQIIPMTKKFCADLTAFLGLEQDGYYIDCCFDDVDCLQQGLKEAEEVKKLRNERCKEQFLCGLISINDWRAQICEEKFEDEVFDKVIFQMTEDEIELINRVFNTKSVGENERTSQEPPVQNEGE